MTPTFNDRLGELGACAEARIWVADRTLRLAWEECERGDWMLWLAARRIGKPGWPTHQQVILAACRCAELALVHIPKGEDRPRRAIETVRRWANGRASIHEVRAVTQAIYEASWYFHSSAASCAAAAIVTCGYAASTDPAYASYFGAAADLAARAARLSNPRIYSREQTDKECADIAREMLIIPFEEDR